jgi:hypothetical protein
MDPPPAPPALDNQPQSRGAHQRHRTLFECQLRGEPVAPELLQELRTTLNELQTALADFEAKHAATGPAPAA